MCKCTRKFVVWIKRNICGHNPGTGGIPPSDPCEKYNKIRLVRPADEVIGKGMHRSGWPYVYKYLQTLNDPKGILFDDFVEQTFCYKEGAEPYTIPWVGVFHHPPYPPAFSNRRESLELLFKTNCAFNESIRHMKMAFALSNHLADFLRERLDCPVVTLKHPIGCPSYGWDPQLYDSNPDKKIVQIGFYQRNMRLFEQFPDVCGFIKLRPHLSKEWMRSWDERVEAYWNKLGIRTTFDTNVKTYKFCTPSQYDEMLSKNVVMMEFFDLSAANGILDCIARNTPLIVNRHPATVEYLGVDYPLYFDRPQEIPELLFKVHEAHEYLVKMDKSWLSGEHFISRLVNHLETLR